MWKQNNVFERHTVSRSNSSYIFEKYMKRIRPNHKLVRDLNALIKTKRRQRDGSTGIVEKCSTVDFGGRDDVFVWLWSQGSKT